MVSVAMNPINTVQSLTIEYLKNISDALVRDEDLWSQGSTWAFAVALVRALFTTLYGRI